MGRGKGKGPIGRRPDSYTAESDSQSASDQPEGDVEGSDFRGDNESSQSQSPSDSEEHVHPVRSRSHRPATPLRPTTSQPAIRISAIERSTQMADMRREPTKRRRGASTSQHPSKRSTLLPLTEPPPNVGTSGGEAQQQEVRAQRGQLSRVRSVHADHASHYPSTDFFDKDAEKSWASVQNRVIIPERRCTLKDDNRLPVRRYFEEVGWGPLLNPKEYYYVKLIRLFYCNMKRKDTKEGDIAIKSWLEGNQVRVTPDILADALHLSDEGMEWEFTNEQKKLSKLVPRSEIMAVICPGAVGNRQPRSRDLTPIARVLLNLLNTNVLPKGGHRESVPPGYAFVIYCLIKGIRLSLPHLMISFMVYCTMDSKTAHTCPYPTAITSLFERANMDMSNMEKTFVKAKMDSGTLARMGIRLPLDQREPLQVEASRATVSRTSAATSYRGEGEGHPEDSQGTGAADDATSRPPDLARLREDVLAMKEQQARLREQLTRIESSQAETLQSLGMIYAIVTQRRQSSSSSSYRGPSPAAYWAAPGIPRQSPHENVGPSRVTIVPLEGDDGEEMQHRDGRQQMCGNAGQSTVENVTCEGHLPPTVDVEVPTGGTERRPLEENVEECAPPRSLLGEEAVQEADQAERVIDEQSTRCTEEPPGQVGHEPMLQDSEELRIDLDDLFAGDNTMPDSMQGHVHV